MSDRVRALLTQALTLHPHEQIQLMEALLENVDSPEAVEAAWTVELKRRLAELEAGTAELMDWDEARALIHRSRQ